MRRLVEKDGALDGLFHYLATRNDERHLIETLSLLELLLDRGDEYATKMAEMITARQGSHIHDENLLQNPYLTHIMEHQYDQDIERLQHTPHQKAYEVVERIIDDFFASENGLDTQAVEAVTS